MVSLEADNLNLKRKVKELPKDTTAAGTAKSAKPGSPSSAKNNPKALNQNQIASNATHVAMMKKRLDEGTTSTSSLSEY